MSTYLHFSKKLHSELTQKIKKSNLLSIFILAEKIIYNFYNKFSVHCQKKNISLNFTQLRSYILVTILC